MVWNDIEWQLQKTQYLLSLALKDPYCPQQIRDALRADERALLDALKIPYEIAKEEGE